MHYSRWLICLPPSDNKNNLTNTPPPKFRSESYLLILIHEENRSNMYLSTSKHKKLPHTQQPKNSAPCPEHPQLRLPPPLHQCDFRPFPWTLVPKYPQLLWPKSYAYVRRGRRSQCAHMKSGFGPRVNARGRAARRRVLHLAAVFRPAYEFIGGHSLDIRDSPA